MLSLSDGNEGAPHISQSSNITRMSISDCLISYPGHSLYGVGSLTPLQRYSWCILQLQIDRAKQNSKHRLYGDRDETIYHIISECSKLVLKEYKTRHDWEGKVIHWELRKKLKFNHITKWYMHNPETVLENEMLKIFWDFEIQTDHRILARQPDPCYVAICPVGLQGSVRSRQVNQLKLDI